MNVGDVFTVEGDYERQSWWLRLKRRLGFKVPEPRLRVWVVARADDFYDPACLTEVRNLGADPVSFNPSGKGTNIAL